MRRYGVHRLHVRLGMPSQTLTLGGPARALLVIDQPPVAQAVRGALNGRYTTRVAGGPAGALAALEDWQPHLVVLDMDTVGNAILERHAEAVLQGGRLPVIALTRCPDLKSKLAAFKRGVDDILTLPFVPEELVARVQAILRRTYRDAAMFTPVLRQGDLEIDIVKRRVRAGKTELHLTRLEQSLLYFLAANAGRVLTRDEILDHLWGVDYVARSNVVDRHVRNLRLKLQSHHHRLRYIATVPRRGYRFLPAV